MVMILSCSCRAESSAPSPTSGLSTGTVDARVCTLSHAQRKNTKLTNHDAPLSYLIIITTLHLHLSGCSWKTTISQLWATLKGDKATCQLLLQTRRGQRILRVQTPPNTAHFTLGCSDHWLSKLLFATAVSSGCSAATLYFSSNSGPFPLLRSGWESLLLGSSYVAGLWVE